jgi:hypothetical protein
MNLPRRLDTDEKYCILEYTPTQRRGMAFGAAYPPEKERSVPQMVPGNPHAMTIFTGMYVNPEGIATPHIITEEVPGVLVASEDFVSGYFYGMIAAFEDSDYGEQPFTEQHVVNAFVGSASDVVMLQGRDMPIEFSIGHAFGYFRGCTLIGTPAFDEWVERDNVPEIQ